VFSEVNSMRMLNHPNIVKLLEVIDTEETLLIVKEYLSGGDFFSHWSSKPDFEARGPLGPNHHGSGSDRGQKQGKKKSSSNLQKCFQRLTA
jgi:serine/threonine protein kinase